MLALNTFIRETEDNRGRGVYCTKHFNYGDEILRENASTVWVSKLYCHSECGYCLNHFNEFLIGTEHIISCELCCRISYCSIECQRLDFVEHCYVCQYLQLIYGDVTKECDFQSNTGDWTEEEDSCLHLCCKVLFLMKNKPELYTKVMSLHGEGMVLDQEELGYCTKVYIFMKEAYKVFHHASDPFVLTQEWVIDLFKKDKSCGFAIMQPPDIRFKYVAKQKYNGNLNNIENQFVQLDALLEIHGKPTLQN